MDLILVLALMVNAVDTHMGIGNCGAKDNGLLAVTYRISARFKGKKGRKGRGFSSMCRTGFKTNEQ